MQLCKYIFTSQKPFTFNNFQLHPSKIKRQPHLVNFHHLHHLAIAQVFIKTIPVLIWPAQPITHNFKNQLASITQITSRGAESRSWTNTLLHLYTAIKSQGTKKSIVLVNPNFQESRIPFSTMCTQNWFDYIEGTMNQFTSSDRSHHTYTQHSTWLMLHVLRVSRVFLRKSYFCKVNTHTGIMRDPTKINVDVQ